MKRLNLLMLAVGLACLVVTIAKVGAAPLVRGATAVGWAFLLVVAVNFLWYAADAWGWAVVLVPGRVRLRDVWRITLAHVAGEALNNATPLLGFGGEPLKGVLAADEAPPDRVVSSLVVNNMIRGLSQLVFLAVGLGVSFFLLDLPGRVRVALLGGFAAAVGGLAAAWVLQRRGLAAWLLELGVRLHVPIGRLAERRAAAARVDALIGDFYRQRRGRFLASFAWHLAARLLMLADALLILALLDHPVTVLQALLVQSVSALINLIFAFIPLTLGASEGGHLFLFAAMKLDMGLGVAFSLVRRVRGLVWVGIGLGIGALRSRRRRAAAR